MYLGMTTIFYPRTKKNQPAVMRRREYTFRCDRCGIAFKRRQKRDQKTDLCSRACLDASHRRGDLLHDKIQSSIHERHGDDFFQRLGKKFGEYSRSEECREKVRNTCLQKYGVSSPIEINRAWERGVEAASSAESAKKRKKTTRERFGVDSVLALPEVHALSNTPEKCQQRHETMRDNGTYFTSKPEDKMYAYLTEKYGEVERQVPVNGWPIDFYVKSVDTYVQFDGEYWHGLDRSLDEIRQFKTPRDKTILRKYEIDREQERWFVENNMKLVRITDKQFSRGEKAGL